jgi:hypothetical protein
MKIGILTLPFATNYGNLLQQFALLYHLKRLGYDTYSIFRKWDKPKKRSQLYYFKRWIYYHILAPKMFQFFKQYIVPKTEMIDSQESMKNLVKYKFDAIIVGSDQVWRTEHTGGVGNNYFLDFVSSDNVAKISYAASFGIDEWEGDIEKTKIVKSLLQDFSLVTVREKSGINICKQYFGIEAHCVLDPTLLLDSDDYEQLIKNDAKSFSKPTLATYILDATKDKQQVVDWIAAMNGYSVFPIYKKKSICKIYYPVQKFLSSIRDADFVLTDSYHGMIFSIIFKKQFIVIGNQRRGLVRFTSLLELLQLQKRLLLEYNKKQVEDIILIPIDYNLVSKALVQERQKSTNLLEGILT